VFVSRVRHHAGTNVPALSLLNFKDEPEEVLDVRPLCSTYLNREPGKKLRDLSREMQLRSSLVVKGKEKFADSIQILAVTGRCLMKTLITHHSDLTSKVRDSASGLLVLLTAAMIATCSLTFAQNVAVDSGRAAMQGVEALTRSHRIAQTEATRRVFVRSKSLLVRAAVVEDKLLKRPEFTQLGFVITREESDADLIFELRHDLLTKYVFSVVDAKTQTLLASGKVSSVGGTVAGKVAKRFVKDMARTPGP